MITKTILTLGIMAGFVIGISFSSVYAGVLIDTDDIADDAITSKKIKDRQVKNPDIRGNTIKSGKIKDGTITSADLNFDPVTQVEFKTHASNPNVHHTKYTDAEAVAAGNYYVKFVEKTVAANTNDGIRVVNCEPGDIATGGGFGSNKIVDFFASRPNSLSAGVTPTGWAVAVDNPTSDVATVFRVVVCFDAKP